MRIFLTGASGFLGFHVRAYLASLGATDVVTDTKAMWEDEAALADALAGCHSVIHLAGMNRGSDDDVYRTNVRLGRILAGALRLAPGPLPTVYASSTHVDRDSHYGRSKRDAGLLLRAACEDRAAPFYELVIPNIFGEFGRPYYNAATATFCHQIANGETPKVDVDRGMELIHAQAVAEEIIARAVGPQPVAATCSPAATRLAGHKLSVAQLLASIQSLNDTYMAGRIPDLAPPWNRDIFNTLRSYYFPKLYPRDLALRSDNRGSLFETIKAEGRGQCFLSTTRPGITRGNHYHRRKFERFCVVAGEATIRLRKLFTSEVIEFRVTGGTPQVVDIPTFHTHNISNCGHGELVTLFWTAEIFDAANPDTYVENV